MTTCHQNPANHEYSACSLRTLLLSAGFIDILVETPDGFKGVKHPEQLVVRCAAMCNLEVYIIITKNIRLRCIAENDNACIIAFSQIYGLCRIEIAHLE